MRQLTFLILISFALGLVACTSDEAKLEKAILQTARQDFETEVDHEIKNRLDPESKFIESYRSNILDRTVYQIEEKLVQGETARAIVRVKGIPFRARKALLDIVNKQGSGGTYSFNVPDALRLILKTMNIPPEGRPAKTYRYQLKKSDGKWGVVKRVATD